VREYGKIGPTFWTDYKGREWPVVRSARRLKFKYPAHAALREHVFARDGFQCRRCDARAEHVSSEWNGHSTLFTNTMTGGGHPDVLVLDHVVSLSAGGRNEVGNFQTLCETCNKRKQKEDIAAARDFRMRSA